jgi:ABC-type glutathione transport system ATPase component
MPSKERADMPEALIVVDDLVVEYPSKGVRRHAFRALKGVSVDIRPGETVGLVGESGSGKTTMGRAILGLAPVTGGSIKFKGREIGSLPRRERRALASEIQVVFQDPYSSLNPSLTIQQTLTEPLLVRKMPKSDATARVRSLLDQVKLPRDALGRLPREFSGGQRQRIDIARALALSQAFLFISHDLAVVRNISHRVAVMYHGEIVEYGDGDQVTTHPSDPYTQRLLLAAPVPDPVRQEKRRTERRAFLAARQGAQAVAS